MPYLADGVNPYDDWGRDWFSNSTYDRYSHLSAVMEGVYNHRFREIGPSYEEYMLGKIKDELAANFANSLFTLVNALFELASQNGDYGFASYNFTTGITVSGHFNFSEDVQNNVQQLRILAGALSPVASYGGIDISGLQSETSPMFLNSELRYSGPNLQWFDNYSDGTSRRIDSWQTNMSYYGNGVLPNGAWTTGQTISPTGLSGFQMGNLDFGVPLNANFDLQGRSGFYIHPDGNNPGTLGCIGLNGTESRIQDFQFRYDRYYSRYGSMNLRVQWALYIFLNGF